MTSALLTASVEQGGGRAQRKLGGAWVVRRCEREEVRTCEGGSLRTARCGSVGRRGGLLFVFAAHAVWSTGTAGLAHAGAARAAATLGEQVKLGLLLGREQSADFGGEALANFSGLGAFGGAFDGFVFVDGFEGGGFFEEDGPDFGFLFLGEAEHFREMFQAVAARAAGAFAFLDAGGGGWSGGFGGTGDESGGEKTGGKCQRDYETFGSIHGGYGND